MSPIALVAALAAAQTADAPLFHRIDVPIARGLVPVTYQGAVTTTTDQRGNAPPGRMITERCHWRATLSVARTIGDGRATRRVANDWRAIGSVPGRCHMAARLIDREIAARLDAAQAALVASAEADRTVLVAELAALDQAAADD